MTRKNSGNAATKSIRTRQFDSANDILTKTLKKFGLDNDIARYKFILRWQEIMGEDISRRTKPEYIRNGILYIRVVDAAWSQELTFQKEIILKRLVRYFGEDSPVRDIKFFIGDLSAS